MVFSKLCLWDNHGLASPQEGLSTVTEAGGNSLTWTINRSPHIAGAKSNGMDAFGIVYLGTISLRGFCSSLPPLTTHRMQSCLVITLDLIDHL
jgi:hypothetical protein